MSKDETHERQVKAVAAVLSVYELPAHYIAHKTGLSLEDTYHCLVSLYDRGQARMTRERMAYRISGWVVA